MFRYCWSSFLFFVNSGSGIHQSLWSLKCLWTNKSVFAILMVASRPNKVSVEQQQKAKKANLTEIAEENRNLLCTVPKAFDYNRSWNDDRTWGELLLSFRVQCIVKVKGEIVSFYKKCNTCSFHLSQRQQPSSKLYVKMIEWEAPNYIQTSLQQQHL